VAEHQLEVVAADLYMIRALRDRAPTRTSCSATLWSTASVDHLTSRYPLHGEIMPDFSLDIAPSPGYNTYRKTTNLLWSWVAGDPMVARVRERGFYVEPSVLLLVVRSVP